MSCHDKLGIAYITVLIPDSCWKSWRPQPTNSARLTDGVWNIFIITGVLTARKHVKWYEFHLVWLFQTDILYTEFKILSRDCGRHARSQIFCKIIERPRLFCSLKMLWTILNLQFEYNYLQQHKTPMDTESQNLI